MLLKCNQNSTRQVVRLPYASTPACNASHREDGNVNEFDMVGHAHLTTQCLLLRIGSRQNFRRENLSLTFQFSLLYDFSSLHSFRKTKPFCKPRASLSHKPGTHQLHLDMTGFPTAFIFPTSPHPLL